MTLTPAWPLLSAAAALLCLPRLPAAVLAARRARLRYRRLTGWAGRGPEEPPRVRRGQGRQWRQGTASRPSRPARWRSRRPPDVPGDGGLPLAAELLAACLAAGASPAAAAAAVGGSLGGSVGNCLQRAATELRLGGEPAAAWGRLAELPGAAVLARQLALADSSGVPAVSAVSAAAAECRARRARAAQVRARRAAVYVTGPLGLCFLPAFLLTGVAPVIIALARTLL